METFKRERRHKYFTLAAYREIAGGEDMRAQDTRYQAIDTSSAGGFLSDTLSKDLFYEDEEELFIHQRRFLKGTHTHFSRNRGLIYYQGMKIENDEIIMTEPKKRGRPRKHPPRDPNAPIRKRGRPRKHPRPEDGDVPADGGEEVEKPPPKKRGRPRKHPVENENTGEQGVESQGNLEQGEEPAVQDPPKRKRGRPRKYPRPDEDPNQAAASVPEHSETIDLPDAGGDAESIPVPSTIPAKRPRGRPRKNRDITPASVAHEGDPIAEDSETEAPDEPPEEDDSPSYLEGTILRRSKRRRIEVRKPDSAEIVQGKTVSDQPVPAVQPGPKGEVPLLPSRKQNQAQGSVIPAPLSLPPTSHINDAELQTATEVSFIRSLVCLPDLYLDWDGYRPTTTGSVS